MKAIVLTCDKYIELADHMLCTYQTQWSSNTFEFRIPYQKYPHFLKKKYGQKVELVKTSSLIKPTVLTLLNDLPDEEWVYWCLDDKYLIQIEEEEVNQVEQLVLKINDPTICGVSFCNYQLFKDRNETLNNQGRFLKADGTIYWQRMNYSRIFHHQFLRVKFLRSLFNSFPDRPFKAKEMDYFIQGKKLPTDQKLYVSNRNMVVFGESTSRGELTLNCAVSLQNHRLEIPANFKISKKIMIIGLLQPKLFGKKIFFFLQNQAIGNTFLGYKVYYQAIRLQYFLHRLNTLLYKKHSPKAGQDQENRD